MICKLVVQFASLTPHYYPKCFILRKNAPALFRKLSLFDPFRFLPRRLIKFAGVCKANHKLFLKLLLHTKSCMNTNALHQNLILAIQEKVPAKTNLAATLMKMLPLGKEAAYRRLRGEVPFTFEEIASLSKQLGFSLDRLTGNEMKNRSQVEFYTIPKGSSVGSFSDMIGHYIEMLRELKTFPEGLQGGITNLIPEVFSLAHPTLVRFKLFKWIYQWERTANNQKFHEIVLPEEWPQLYQELVELCSKLNLTFDVWDNDVFAKMINDIHYFHRIGLIRDNDVKKIWEDLEKLLDELSEVALRGRVMHYNPIQIYVSHVSFDGTYGYLEGNDFQLSSIRIFDLSSIFSYDQDVTNTVKEWILSLKKFSTLISESGEMQRVEFFRRQRELIETNVTLFP